MTAFSILDLAPVREDGNPGDALRNARDLARHVEALGYLRFWLAEHHNMIGIASAATSVAIGYVAEGTSSIRVGAGGVMLPNHAPLVIAEVERSDPKAPLTIPPWCGEEITGELRWSNAVLAQHPVQSWPEEQRRRFGWL